VAKLIDLLVKQAESSKSFEIIMNQLQSFICFDMKPDLFHLFSDFILSKDRSSLNSLARLDLAKLTLEISTTQNNEKL
jgi:hypothetical protein